VDWLRTPRKKCGLAERAITEPAALLESLFISLTTEAQILRNVLHEFELNHRLDFNRTLGLLHCHAPQRLEWTTPWGSLLRLHQTQQGITASISPLVSSLRNLPSLF